MPTAGIKLLVVGSTCPTLPYDVRHIDSSSSILAQIAQFQPDVIMTTGFMPGVLNAAPFDIRKRWIHPASDATAEALIQAVESCYRHNLWTPHSGQAANPLVSVYTGTYNTGDYLRETYQSLKEQTYTNWEWVVVDDHSSDGTWDRLEAMAKEDVRVRPYRSGKRLGKIGAVKDFATRLANGSYLVELDHDDMLTDYAIDEIRKAFQANPAVGMVYSNCSNFFENGTFHRFTDNFWKDRYRETEYRGKKWTECLQPDIYDRFGPNYWDQFGYFLTVGPNHVRAFRASTFRELGGYNQNLPVADDWDLYARFFLRSQCLRIDRMLYLYRFRDNWANTTFTRNKSIQDHLKLGRDNYAQEFDAFNKKRLAPKTGGQAIALTIAVPAIPERMKGSLLSVMDELVRQAQGKPVEVMCALDNRARTLSEKRNQMIASAKGSFIAFVDDDDRVEPDYVDQILAAIRKDPEVDCVLFDVMVHGYDAQPKVCKYDPSYQDKNAPEAYYRRPNHVMAFRTEISRRHAYSTSRSSVDEDFEWARRAIVDVKKTTRIEKALYHYLYDPKSSTAQKSVAPQPAKQEIRKKPDSTYPKIRIVAISKNEEGCIDGFFKQFDAVTWDWCLLDTGSTDKTVEIAGAAGVRVETCLFENFEQARNEALKRFSGGADWIVMLDPDERLDGHTISHLPELLLNAQEDILLAPLDAQSPDGSRRSFVPKPFAFRADKSIRWTFKVHEKLIGSQRQAIVENALILHVLSLHDAPRRAGSEGLYQSLMKQEPYFTDAAYRERMRKDWPILDYDRLRDPRIRQVYAGPLVSVVIPTFKRPDLLKRAVASVLAQDYVNVEAVVVGDQCPDLDGLKLDGPRVWVFNLKENHGAGGAAPRNHGISMARGEFIAYLDDDNAWEPNHVSSLYQALRETDSDWAFSSMKAVDHVFKFEEPQKGKLDTSCVLHKRSLVRDHGPWKDRSEAGYAHDWEFFSRWLHLPWVATGKPTLVYNADTSGQKDYLLALAKSGA